MIKIYPSKFSGELSAPPSESYAEKLIFAASLNSLPTEIVNIPDCADLDTAIQILIDFGCTIEKHGNSKLKIFPFVKTQPVKSASFDFRQSGNIAHLALPIAAAMNYKLSCRMSTPLIKRPLVPLTSRMALRGVTFSSFNFPLQMQGVLLPGEYSFSGEEASVYACGLLIALPMLGESSRITLTSELTDRTNIDNTIKAVKHFGIEIEEDEKGFFIPGNQIYRCDEPISVENDWTLAAMWTCAGCLTSGEDDPELRLINLPENPYDLYKDFKTTMAFLKQDVRFLNIDAVRSPELAVLYAAIAAVKGSGIEIKNITALEYKDTNYMRTISEIIKDLGGEARPVEAGIIAEENPNLKLDENSVIDCRKDPWTAMALSIACSALKTPVIIKDAECIDRVYRNFYKDFESIGGKYEIIE